MLFSQQIQSPVESDREEALEQLSEQNLAPFAEVACAAKDRSPSVRMAFLEACPLYGEAIVHKEARHALNDRNELVRVTALELFLDWPPTSEASLKQISILFNDKSPLVRRTVAEILGATRMPQYIDMLKLRLQNERSQQARLGLLSGLFRSGEKSVEPLLQNMFKSKDYRIRCATANLHGELYGGTNRRDILQVLSNALQNESTIAARSSLKNAIKEIRRRKTPTG